MAMAAVLRAIPRHVATTATADAHLLTAPLAAASVVTAVAAVPVILLLAEAVEVAPIPPLAVAVAHGVVARAAAVEAILTVVAKLFCLPPTGRPAALISRPLLFSLGVRFRPITATH